MHLHHAITVILSILLTSCATPPKPQPQILPPAPEPVTIQIRTLPAGGIISYNGDTLGPSPISINTDTRTRNRWPANGKMFQQFEAHWPDGRWTCESYPTAGTVPGMVILYAP